MEEPLYIFTMKGFCNNIYNNSHKIIGWDPNEVKKKLERVTAVMVDVSGVGTGGGRISEGEVNIV